MMRNYQSIPTRPQITLTHGHGEKILIVDDEPQNMYALSQSLSKLGYEVQTALDGPHALDIAEHWYPDLLLLDIMLPGMDGLEICEHLKQNIKTNDIPIIFISAIDNMDHKVNALSLGGVDYITKPLHIREVLARVQTHLTVSMLQKSLQTKNKQLYQEIQERRNVEDELKQYKHHLEELVAARTEALQQEIAERKRVEVELRKLSQAIEQSLVTVILINTMGTIEYVNPKCAEMTGYDREAIVGQKLRALLSDETPEDIHRQLWETITSGGEWQGELCYQKKDRGSYWGHTGISPIRNPEGIITHFIAMHEDITERKQMAQQLRQHAEHLELMVQEKVHELEMARTQAIQNARLASMGEMATGIAHELNQPLTAILFEADYLQLLAQKALKDGAGVESLDAQELYRIGRNLAADVTRARRITDYLRTFNRISRGHLIESDINYSLENSFVLTEARLRESGVIVRRTLDPDLPPIYANPPKLEQIFLNLLSNAEYALNEMERRIKNGTAVRPNYQKRLAITTALENDMIVATIADNGCGIPEAFQARIFEPFVSTRPEGEAAGLGLAICQSLVAEFQGTLTFESIENEGTTFILRFPIQSSSENASGDANPHRAGDLDDGRDRNRSHH